MGQQPENHEQRGGLGGAVVVTPDTENLNHSLEDYPVGIIVPIDKPYRWTSADVVRKIKFAAARHFAKRNVKVGHAGTLDPLATGILIVCIGPATKLAQTLQDHDKEYVAGITFGATTLSYDLEKPIDRRMPCDHITPDLIRGKLSGFIGEQEQVAPLFSAKSVDGVRAYELARKLFRARQRGERADLDEKAMEIINVSKIHIKEAELLEFDPVGNTVLADRQAATRFPTETAAESGTQARTGTTLQATSMSHTPSGRINVFDTSALGLPRANIRIACSKGTYIRAFARDLGEALGSGAHLDALRRTKNGPFDITRAVPLSLVLSLLT